jgi:uncharacterized protein YutE (UPF0331/DUF86 family)
MSSVQEIVIRLEKLKLYRKYLEELLNKCGLADFKRDFVLRGALERYLQLAAEVSIDIGEIIISELELSAPMANRDVFEMLGEEKILTEDLSKSFVRLAGFRNVLVHDYLKLSLEKMYAYLQNDLGDFDKFIRSIAKFLKKYDK